MKSLKRTFQYFRNILDLNNQVLEYISGAERALGGNYIFDSAFLAEFVTDVCETTREVIYNFNALTDCHNLALYDRLESIRFALEDIVAGGVGIYGQRLTLPYELINRDLDEVVGAKNANLADMYNNFEINVPNGFAITVKAYELFLEKNEIIPKIERVYRAGGDTAFLKRQVAEIFEQAKVPSELALAVKKELEVFLNKLGRECLLAVRSSAVGEDAERSFAGQFHTFLNVKPQDLLDVYKKVIMARFLPEVMDYLGKAVDLRTSPVAVGVQEMIDSSVSGVAYTRDPVGRRKDHIVISAVAGSAEKLVGGHIDGDHYMLSRTFPYHLLSSMILEKPVSEPLPPGIRPIDTGRLNMRRGSSYLDISNLKSIAEIAMLCEKAFGTPMDIEWALDKKGNVVLLQNRPLGIQPSSEPIHKELTMLLSKFPLLLDGLGHTVQLGAASGTVVRVDPEGDMDKVPVGAILVSRYAHPKLSKVLKRAGAIVTDIGSATGHLATIAREYRVPAIFGTGIATMVLQDGMQVTVDADYRRVYEGIIEELVEFETRQDWQYMEEPELKALRRALAYVAPLYLTDPASKDFSPEKCKTIHDIIHYCHIRAVDALISKFSSLKALKYEKILKLKADLPIEISVIDVGGGVECSSQVNEVSVDQVKSVPFRALLSGLVRQEAWDMEPVVFGMGDLLSSMVRPVNMLTNPPEYSGQNLAIVAEDYMNISLLLGYHYNVIDAFISEEPDYNYIYFRFAGGFAEEKKRKKRAQLISWILESFGFVTEVRKDVVIGKLKGIDKRRVKKILERIGWLIGFTRQLDVRMSDEAAVERFYCSFLDHCGECL